MSVPDLVPLIVQHLKKLPHLKNNVFGAIELEHALENPKFVAPAMYALRLGELAGESTNFTVITQRVSVIFGLVYAVPNNTRGTGIISSAAPDELMPYRNPVINAVLGWQASPEYDPAIFKRGRLVHTGSKVLWWEDQFETAFYLRQQ